MFKLTEDQKDIMELVTKFCEKEVKPLAAIIDEENRFPHETVQKMVDMGLMGGFFPEEYGGAGIDYITFIMICEELAKVCAATSCIYSAHVGLCCWPIYNWGTEEQKQKFLRPLCEGKKLGAFALTEPSAGTDAAMQKSFAEKQPDGSYILNGSKVFITNGGYADVVVVFAMSIKGIGTKGITAFILEKGMPGFTVGKSENKMGIRGSSTCELFFDNVHIPAENVLGQEGKGFSMAMQTLDGGRCAIGAQALGIAEGAIDETVKYTSERIQFGKRISQFQNTQFELADMKANTEAAKLLVYRASLARQNGEPYSHYAAMAKLFASENASDVTRRCVQLFGGYGFTKDFPVERMMRDAKITEIYEGTSEVQKMVISGWMGVK